MEKIDYSILAYPKPKVEKKAKKQLMAKTPLRSGKRINPVSDKRKKEYAKEKNIYEEIKGCKCDLCKCKDKETEMHHLVYGTANRKLSTKYKLILNLCPDCHKEIHKLSAKKAKAIGQEVFERSNTREEFMRIFGKNYLD